MAFERDHLPDPNQVQAQARAWYAQQIKRISKAHGPAWEGNREWIEDYLKQEVRQKLQKRGWRANSNG